MLFGLFSLARVAYNPGMQFYTYLARTVFNGQRNVLKRHPGGCSTQMRASITKSPSICLFEKEGRGGGEKGRLIKRGRQFPPIRVSSVTASKGCVEMLKIFNNRKDIYLPSSSP